jgi:ATP-binding cassette subfamily F protein uup
MEEQEKEEKAKVSKAKTQETKQINAERETKNTERKKLSYKEQKEFEALEVEIPQLEQQKTDIENQLASGTLSSDEIIKASQRHGELNDLIDEKTMRWLELSEI